MTRRSELAIKLLLTAGVAGGGGAFVVGRVAVGSTPPATLATYRYVLALLLFAAVLFVTKTPWQRPTLQDGLRIAGMGLAVVAGYNLLFLQGLRLAPAADGGLIVPGSAPVFSILMSSLVLRERPPPRALAGCALACAGILAIFAAAGGFGQSSPERRAGDLLYLVGGSMWGLFNVLARGLHGRVGPLVANTYAAAVGLVLIAALALLTERQAILAPPSAGTWLEAGYLAAFATVLLLWAQVTGVARLGVSGAAPFSYVAPVVAVAGSVLFLGEQVSGLVLLGGVLALAGTWIATSTTRLRIGGRRRPSVHAEVA